MEATLLPLFPLPLVVFPRTELPLHIFEERYKEMVGQAIRDHSEFGIALTREGAMAPAGCTVRVDRVDNEYPDGRLDIVTSGVRRFETILLNAEKSYLRAEVQFFDDDETSAALEPLQFQALARYRELMQIGEAPAVGHVNFEDPQLSFQLAQGLPELDFLQTLLNSRSEADRLRQVAEFLSGYVPRQRTAVRMKKLSPLNGHGVKPPED